MVNAAIARAPRGASAQLPDASDPDWLRGALLGARCIGVGLQADGAGLRMVAGEARNGSYALYRARHIVQHAEALSALRRRGG